MIELFDLEKFLKIFVFVYSIILIYQYYKENVKTLKCENNELNR